MSVEIEVKISRAESNLQRKLEWISRYDTRITLVAGTSIAMLGVLASASGLITSWSVIALIVFIIAFILLGLSLVFVYFSQKPNDLAPNKSLLFFGTIGKMSFSEFDTGFKNYSNDEYLEDLLHQIHINSQILCKKFTNLKYALFCIALAVLPWGIAIYISKLYLH